METSEQMGFMDLPRELRDQIYDLVAPLDRILIPSKPIRGGLYTTRATAVFTTSEYEAYHNAILLKSKVISVVIVDYIFDNFIKFLTKYVEKASGSDSLERFFHVRDLGRVPPEPPVSFQLLEGCHFNVSLRFTKAFDPHQARLMRWLKKVSKLEAKIRHLRVFYKVTRVEHSPAINAHFSSLDPAEETQSQFTFILRALSTAFWPRTATHLVDPKMDINAGWFSKDGTLAAGALRPGENADVAKVKVEPRGSEDEDGTMGGVVADEDMEVKQEPDDGTAPLYTHHLHTRGDNGRYGSLVVADEDRMPVVGSDGWAVTE